MPAGRAAGVARGGLDGSQIVPADGSARMGTIACMGANRWIRATAVRRRARWWKSTFLVMALLAICSMNGSDPTGIQGRVRRLQANDTFRFHTRAAAWCFTTRKRQRRHGGSAGSPAAEDGRPVGIGDLLACSCDASSAAFQREESWSCGTQFNVRLGIIKAKAARIQRFSDLAREASF